ncbi:hypothetical protein SAMN05216571_11377 [Onishia taeanensis]|uniref:Uncharacterized protein n=1 Tax=Onishia taeanensis TaxID=284577 RepID=A0A1G7U862_9GAMM|nr:hypothetical protein [Halomonas taeanensis]SDG43825.1 hypothetical protein SAMN05216571_11377 [Halomonas taeanensis]
MRYLILMYVIMTLGFFWNLKWSLVVFTLTWVLCLVFKSYLPSVPYPRIDQRYLYPGPKPGLIFYSFFVSPALLAAALYQGMLLVDPAYLRSELPLADLGAFTRVLLFDRDNDFAYPDPVQGLETVYLLRGMLTTYFIVFVYFVAHWFCFYVEGFRNIKQEPHPPQSPLDFSFWKWVCLFVGLIIVCVTNSLFFILMIGMEPWGTRGSGIIVYLTNHWPLALLMQYFFWCAAWVSVWMMINALSMKCLRTSV